MKEIPFPCTNYRSFPNDNTLTYITLNLYSFKINFASNKLFHDFPLFPNSPFPSPSFRDSAGAYLSPPKTDTRMTFCWENTFLQIIIRWGCSWRKLHQLRTLIRSCAHIRDRVSHSGQSTALEPSTRSPSGKKSVISPGLNPLWDRISQASRRSCMPLGSSGSCFGPCSPKHTRSPLNFCGLALKDIRVGTKTQHRSVTPAGSARPGEFREASQVSATSWCLSELPNPVYSTDAPKDTNINDAKKEHAL